MTSGPYSRSPVRAPAIPSPSGVRWSGNEPSRAFRPSCLRRSRSSSACVCLPLWSSPSNAMSRPESAFKGEDILEGLAPANHRPLPVVDEHLGGKHVAVVVGSHHGTVRAGVENRDQVVDLE